MAQPTLQSITPRSRRHRRTRKWIRRGLLIAGALAVLAALVYAWAPRPVVVETAVARRSALDVVVETDGRTQVRDRFVVASPITGTLARVELEPGDAVTAGAAVAYVSPPDPAILDVRSRAAAEARIAAASAQQRQAMAAIARARAARDQAAHEARRSRALHEAGAVPGSQREQAELAERLAIEDLRAAEQAQTAAAADLAAARSALGRGVRPSTERVTVTAPAAGRVLRVVRDSAGPIVAGAPILELGDPADLEVVYDVLSADAARIPIGARVVVENWGGPPLAGIVRRVEPSAFTRVSALGIDEQRVHVIVGVPAAPARLGDAFRVDGRIVIWHGDRVLTVPASAVFRDHDRWVVYVVRDGRAALVPIEIGHRGRLDVEVTRGLDAGDRVILHPSDQVTAGARVRAE